MAESSFPFSSSTLATEEQWTRSNRALGHGEAVVNSLPTNHNPPDLQVAGNGGNTVTIADGEASINGFFYSSTLVQTRPVPTNASGSTARTDVVVLEVNQSTNQVTVKYLTGGTVAPTPIHTLNGIWQMPLANVTVRAGSTTVAAADVTDRRQFVVPQNITMNSGSVFSGTGRLGQQMLRPDGLYLYTTSGWTKVWPDDAIIYSTPSFTSPFRNYNSGAGDGYSEARYGKASNGRVYLEGLVETSSTALDGATIFVLPAGFRPAKARTCIAWSRNRNSPGQSTLVDQAQRVDIWADGRVRAMNGLYVGGWLSLENISFPSV